MNRPIGVTIVAVLELVRSLMGLLIALGMFFFKDAFINAFFQNSEFQQSTQQLPPGALQAGINIAGAFTLIGVLIGLLLAYGLFNLKRWAWIVTLIFAILGILSDVISLVQGQAMPGLSVLQLVISAVIVYYLLQPQVKRAFGR